MHLHVIRAIFRRNFVSYFANPTGYVFIVVFVFLTSLATFWPTDFFNANLANLNQLSKWLPYIMLVFIPAVTMSIWADERRQGTDELLLTIPAADLDVVVGKYLASVAIFTVALLFSMVCNWITLVFLGWPDNGLYLSTYLGYWLVGLAMLSVGMIASFLSASVPIAFILGVLFNAPLAMANLADAVPFLPDWFINVKRLSVAEQFADCSRGVISAAGVAYFVGIALVMLYAAMVLIGRRHWRGGSQDPGLLPLHYFVRFLCLLVTVVGVNLFLTHHDRLRLDLTTERLNSLSPETVQLIQKLKPEQDIYLHAYIGNKLPENLEVARLNLITILREITALNNPKIHIEVKNDLETYSEDAALAEQAYGIKPRMVEYENRGIRDVKNVIFGFAVESGLEKNVIPFISPGVPLEFEVVHRIFSVGQRERKKVGILKTDAKLFAGFDMASMSATPDERLITELRKQYDVEAVDPEKPIKTDEYVVLVAVQPSSLSPQGMDNFATAVLAGQPTAIFEDPYPWPALSGQVAGTAAPRRPQGGGMMGGGGPPQPKGDIARKLFKPLGIKIPGADVVWQDYNPKPKLTFGKIREFVYIGPENCPQPFEPNNLISAGLYYLLFPFPGSIINDNSKLTFEKLAVTGIGNAGAIPVDSIKLTRTGFPDIDATSEAERASYQGAKEFTLAAYVHGKPKAEKREAAADEPEVNRTEESENPATQILGAAAEKKDPERPNADIKVVVVADIDCLFGVFFDIRDEGEANTSPGENLNDCTNVAFVLNTIDFLAGETSFLNLRKRMPKHHTLSKFEEIVKDSRKTTDEVEAKMSHDLAAKKADVQKRLEDKLNELKSNTEISMSSKNAQLIVWQVNESKKLEKTMRDLEENHKKSLDKIKNDLESQIRKLQDGYKMRAVVIPPIPPLLLALYMFFNRRAKEREGISQLRLVS